ncbi:hypothetical protein K432DRAFT_392853 [Lepidopterella palustris CBS 459.81]|uniref:Uncharacterized protein n=1 Tax=Lepidopterella palustris CBS 459.81 TaxID=1314670 RepID=A0A8E2EBT9_9PEZI|nr:hypothetical protein K432DRAFT_392853 [Lepidopterella palustris CBS 459.81]
MTRIFAVLPLFVPWFKVARGSGVRRPIFNLFTAFRSWNTLEVPLGENVVGGTCHTAVDGLLGNEQLDISTKFRFPVLRAATSAISDLESGNPQWETRIGGLFQKVTLTISEEVNYTGNGWNTCCWRYIRAMPPTISGVGEIVGVIWCTTSGGSDSHQQQAVSTTDNYPKDELADLIAIS